MIVFGIVRGSYPYSSKDPSALPPPDIIMVVVVGVLKASSYQTREGAVLSLVRATHFTSKLSLGILDWTMLMSVVQEILS